MILIKNENRTLSHILRFQGEGHEAFFEFEYEGFDVDSKQLFSIKLFLSNVYITFATSPNSSDGTFKFDRNNLIDMYTLKLDTNGEKCLFKVDSDNNLWYKNYGILVSVNNKLVIVNHNSLSLKINKSIVQYLTYTEVPFYVKPNDCLKLMFNEYVFREIKDQRTVGSIEYDYDEEYPIYDNLHVYDVRSIFDIMLVYHNCRSYALVDKQQNKGYHDLINVLGLNMVNNSTRDNMFLTKVDTEQKTISHSEVGKKLGYKTYMFFDLHTDGEGDGMSASFYMTLPNGEKIQVGPVEIFQLKNVDLDELKKYYNRLLDTMRTILASYTKDCYLELIIK